MPVIHTAHDPEEIGLGYLLASWAGELRPEDCLRMTPDPTMAAAAEAQGCSLEVRVPDFLKDSLEFEVIGNGARVVLPGLQVIWDAKHRALPWQPPMTTELRWTCDRKLNLVDLVLRLMIDSNQRQSLPVWRDGLAPLPSQDFAGPIVTLSWWGKPRRVGTPRPSLRGIQ